MAVNKKLALMLLGPSQPKGKAGPVVTRKKVKAVKNFGESNKEEQAEFKNEMMMARKGMMKGSK